MGKFNALVLAGAFALAAGGAASAADLLPPPAPEPVLADPVFDGWYLRADVGVGLNTMKLRQSYNEARGGKFFPRNAENDIRTDQSSIGDSAFLRAGFGYQINPWFRADVTGEYRTSSNFHAVESYRNTHFQGMAAGQGSCGTAPVRFVSPNNVVATGRANPIQRCYDNYSAQVQSSVVMANGYVDLGTWYNLTPFVGAGVGIARNSISNLADFGNNGGAGIAPNSSKWSPAYAAMAGLAYSVTPNLKLELGYRYLNMGSISSKDIVCNNVTPGSCHYESQKLKLASSDVHIGMRWLLSANAYGNGQALYWGQNGAASGSLTGGYAGARVASGYVDPGAGGRPLTRRY